MHNHILSAIYKTKQNNNNKDNRVRKHAWEVGSGDKPLTLHAREPEFGSPELLSEPLDVQGPGGLGYTMADSKEALSQKR